MFTNFERCKDNEQISISQIICSKKMICSHYLNKIVSLNTYYSSHRAAFEFKL